MSTKLLTVFFSPISCQFISPQVHIFSSHSFSLIPEACVYFLDAIKVLWLIYLGIQMLTVTHLH
jgi:hypothetical protein